MRQTVLVIAGHAAYICRMMWAHGCSKKGLGSMHDRMQQGRHCNCEVGGAAIGYFSGRQGRHETGNAAVKYVSGWQGSTEAGKATTSCLRGRQGQL